MPYLPGESVNLGVGGESQAARGVAVAPTSWIPARTPTGIRTVLEKTLVKETRASGVMSQGSEITQKRAEGDLEFNVRAESIGWLLLSLFGSASSVAKAGGNSSVYDHTFSILANNPQHPSLTLALRQPNIQDYEYAMGIVGALEFKTPVDDLVNATVTFMAKSEAEHAAYTVAFNETNDPYFKGYNVTVKFAANVAGLDAATAVPAKEFSLSLNNNGRPNQVLGSQTPNDMLSLLMEISGSLKIDYLNKTYHDYFANGTYLAMRVEMTRTDLTIGASANPKLVLEMPKVSFEDNNPDRPLDDIVMEDLKIQAHYDSTTAKAITATLTNLKTTYNVA
jgi:Phage tail tube protein